MSRVRLSVVGAGEELSGATPAEFERLARQAEVGSPEHRGVVMIALTLAGRAASTCVPPTIQADLRAHLGVALSWVKGSAGEKDVKTARAACFGSVTACEQATKDAIRKAQAHLSSDKAPHASPLDQHADHVVGRYAGLAAHFTVSAVCHTLDSVTDPSAALGVLGDVEGARAYQAAGLGAARHAAFRKAAWDQAAWESERTPSSTREETMVLAVQIFHEYLGGRWRRHADAERLKNEAFVSWALGSRVSFPLP